MLKVNLARRLKQGIFQLTAVTLVALCVTSASAAPMEAEDPVSLVNPATFWVSNMPAIYFHVFGEYPRSWKEVTDSKLFQVQLRTQTGLAVDPDDGKLDFYGDVQYVYHGQYQPAEWIVMGNQDGTVVHREQCSTTSASYKTMMLKIGKATGERFPEHWGNDSILLQWGMAECMNLVCREYLSITGGKRSLRSMNELLACPLSPYDANSINPLTGMPFGGSSLSNDFDFRWKPLDRSWGSEFTQDRVARVVPVDYLGKPMAELYSFF